MSQGQRLGTEGPGEQERSLSEMSCVDAEGQSCCLKKQSNLVSWSCCLQIQLTQEQGLWGGNVVSRDFVLFVLFFISLI